MKILTNGCTRLVVLTSKWAIKLPRFDYGWAQGLRGLLANMQEVEFSALDDKACPVIFYIFGGWLLVMPRCKPLSDNDWNTIKNTCVGEWLPIPVEYRKRDSFGIFDGRIVAVDYGS